MPTTMDSTKDLSPSAEITDIIHQSDSTFFGLLLAFSVAMCALLLGMIQRRKLVRTPKKFFNKLGIRFKGTRSIEIAIGPSFLSRAGLIIFSISILLSLLCILHISIGVPLIFFGYFNSIDSWAKLISSLVVFGTMFATTDMIRYAMIK